MYISKWNESFGLNGLTEKFRQMYPSSEYVDMYTLNNDKYIIIKRNTDFNNVFFLGKYGKFYNNIWNVIFFSKNTLNKLESVGKLDDLINNGGMIIELTETQNKDIRTIIHMYCRGFISE